jgi:hypothetical protein
MFKTSCVIVVGIILSLLSGETVKAGTIHNNWYYAFDSLSDSVGVGTVGGTEYEIAGMGYGQRNGQSIFAIVQKMPLEGVEAWYADDGHIALGDILLNFTTDSFNVASSKGKLNGLHFVGNNGAGVSAFGFYDDVVAKSMSVANGLTLANVAAYHDYVQNNGGTPSVGDLPVNTSEIDSSQHILNVIASGNWKGNVNILDANALKNLGFDSGYFGVQGYNTIGISFDSSLIPTSQFTALFSPECGNDIMAMIVPARQKVPESSATLGLLVFGTVGSLVIKNRKKSVVIS